MFDKGFFLSVKQKKREFHWTQILSCLSSFFLLSFSNPNPISPPKKEREKLKKYILVKKTVFICYQNICYLGQQTKPNLKRCELKCPVVSLFGYRVYTHTVVKWSVDRGGEFLFLTIINFSCLFDFQLLWDL